MKVIIDIPEKYIDSTKAIISLSMSAEEEKLVDVVSEELKAHDGAYELDTGAENFKDASKQLFMSIVAALIIQQIDKHQQKNQYQ